MPKLLTATFWKFLLNFERFLNACSKIGQFWKQTPSFTCFLVFVCVLCSWVTCAECGHVMELSGETLDLTSRVTGLKEMVKKLKRENQELCMQNENFNVQLSTSRNQLLQLSQKLNTAGQQLTVYKRGKHIFYYALSSTYVLFLVMNTWKSNAYN